MRGRSAVFVAAAVFVAVPSYAQDQSCGGDNPDWLLVTLVKEVSIFDSEWHESEVNEQALLKVCSIRTILVVEEGTRIVFHQYSQFDPDVIGWWYVAETLAEICAALQTCGDATRGLTDAAPRDR